MKFKKNFIYEVIAKFENFYKALGIKYIRKERHNDKIVMYFEIFIYNHKTAENLIKSKKFCVFFVSDFTIFYDVIMKNFDKIEDKINKFPSANFEIYENVKNDDGILIKCFSEIERKN
ncbi:MAG: hypothetical protein ACK4YO_00075, partial [Candidatus Altarchaeaceae archaeon]